MICAHGIHMDNACGKCDPPRGTNDNLQRPRRPDARCKDCPGPAFGLCCRPAGAPPEAGWVLPFEKVKHLTSLPDLLAHAKRAHYTNATVRKDGKETTYEADWIKHLRWIGDASHAAPADECFACGSTVMQPSTSEPRGLFCLGCGFITIRAAGAPAVSCGCRLGIKLSPWQCPVHGEPAQPDTGGQQP